jgi:hypothetical protein
MKIKSVSTQYFDFDGRGCELVRWIHDAELHLSDSQAGFAPLPGSIDGAQYLFESDESANESWVIFHRLQVLHIVPEEVHSYWHRDLAGDDYKNTGVWEVEDSEWRKSFNPRHLENQKHFIIEFYDELIELICGELIFGSGKFDVEQVVVRDSRFAYTYLRRAMAQENLGNRKKAVEYFQKYIEICPDGDSVEYARRCIESKSTGSAD